MDSLTQFTLGAAVSAALLGPKIGPRKAALIGGLLGTLPDLDVLIPFETKIDEFVYHRGWSHSVFTHIVATPIIGEVVRRTSTALKPHLKLVWTTVLLCFFTHVLIDAMNSYGARVFWPFYPDPVGAGSIFIIDLFFTIPLLIAVIWAFISAQWTRRLRTMFISAFIISFGYLVAGLVIQSHIHERGQAIFAAKGVNVDNVQTVVSPFNIILWRVIGQEEGKYHNLYVSLFDDDDNARIYTHEFDASLISCVADDPEYQKMVWFSDGFVRLDLRDSKIVASDYRLGITPSYVFQFEIAEYADGQATKINPNPVAPDLSNAGTDFGWLGTRILGQPSIRQSEQDLVDAVKPAISGGC